MKWFSIGSLSFPASWAAIVAAFFAVYLYLWLQGKKQAAELYSNSFFIFIVTWKLSVILLQFQSIIKNPLSIVYFNGGTKGYWLGFAAAILYLFRAEKKSNFREQGHHVEVWIVIITLYELVFYLLNKGHIFLLGFQFLGNILLLLIMRKRSGDPVWNLQLLILFTFFQGLVYSFQGKLLSTPMLTYTVGALILGWAAWKGSRKSYE